MYVPHEQSFLLLLFFFSFCCKSLDIRRCGHTSSPREPGVGFFGEKRVGQTVMREGQGRERQIVHGMRYSGLVPRHSNEDTSERTTKRFLSSVIFYQMNAVRVFRSRWPYSVDRDLYLGTVCSSDWLYCSIIYKCFKNKPFRSRARFW